MKAITRYFACDFETTVYEGQKSTEVWAACVCELFTDNMIIFHSIDELYDYFMAMDHKVIAYFHNLKFDGAFWLSFLLGKKKYNQAYTQLNEEATMYKWHEDKEMKNHEIKYSISAMGQWYTIKIKEVNVFLEIRDSLKLLPFSIKKMGKSFGTKHKKLDMEYKGKRYAGCEITEKEQEYIKNDVYVLKEALEIMFKEGHTKLTIGSCCLSEYKSTFDGHGEYLRSDYRRFFPNLFEIKLNPVRFGSDNVGEYIRNSYHGGWCYLVPEKANKKIYGGITADVNSLYPSVMSHESGNKYPVGVPTFWYGDYIPSDLYEGPWADRTYYFIRIKTRFYIKDGYLPCIQIKGNPFYKSNVWQTTSDIFNPKTGKYDKFYYDIDGELQPARVELTLTKTDFLLIQEHYDLADFEVLDGCYFEAVGFRDFLFDDYILKYKKIKMNSTGAIRELAKLFLNNLYGKMASSPDSSFKVARVDEESGALKYISVPENDKIPGYIPVGSCITSYARNFTIRHAQMNYHGPDKPGFIYADTDSIHCDLNENELIGIEVSDTDFCKWKLESKWDIGYFIRQKTYIEHITHENLIPVEKPYFSIRCAGLNQRGKDLFLYSIGDEATMEKLDNENKELEKDFTELEKDFISEKRKLEDFTVGIEIPGKLIPKNIDGGIVLQDTTFKLR